MREKKLPELAGTAAYPAGGNPWNGGPTKIVPPSGYMTTGKWPGDAFAAQWQNYLDNALQKQIERSAQIPFRNFVEVAAIPATTSLPRFAFSRWAGSTLVANGVNNTVPYFQEFLEASAGAPLALTLAPASGTFVPKDVCEVDGPPDGLGTYKPWVVVGTNTTAPTKTIWAIGRDGRTELTSPVSGSVELVCKDRTTGILYAFAADTNRSVLVRNSSTGAWTVLGTRGAGAVAPSAANSYCSANGGIIGLVYPTGGSVGVESITTASFSVTASTTGFAESPLDLRWSPQHNVFMLLTDFRTYTSPALQPATFVQVNQNGTGTPAFVNLGTTGGCLHDTGVAAWHDNGSGAWGLGGAPYLWVQDYLDTNPHVLHFGPLATGGASTGVLCRFDGTALWFMLDKSGTKRLFRSIRL